MASHESSSTGGSSLPSPESIREIMRECDCNEERAINLLRRSNNDPEKAKHQHRTLMRFINRIPVRPAPTPPRPISPTPEPDIDEESENDSEEAELEESQEDHPETQPYTNSWGPSRPVIPGYQQTPGVPTAFELPSHPSGIASRPFQIPTPSSSTSRNSQAESESGGGSRRPIDQNTPPETPPINGEQLRPNFSIPRVPVPAVPAMQTPNMGSNRPEEPIRPRYQAYNPHPPDFANPTPAITPDESSVAHRDRMQQGRNALQEAFQPLEVEQEMEPSPPPYEENPVIGPEVIIGEREAPPAPEPAYIPEPEPEPEWNFILPEIPPPPTLTPGLGDGQAGFNLQDLIGAIQHGAPLQMIQHYLGYYDKPIIKRHLNDTVEGFPAMFYAVATNNEWIIRTFIAYGANLKCIHDASKVPLLAFAIMHSETLQADTTLIVATLLSLGALPQVIPSAFYTPYCKDLPDNGPTDAELTDITDENKTWCTNAARAKLARTTNLTQRYYLERAAKTKKPSIRHRQIALRRNAEALLGIPYFLIGQTMAANRLLQKLLSHLVVPSQRPLVLVFAGPSGHGKTELARRLGHLLSLELEVVDCTIFNRESELFGPRHPYVGADRGSPLNNFLARNAGQRCIVFLDEFEKTTSDIHQALLLPFDNGEYQDRRHLTTIDCSKTIWILATNALDPTIQDFCAQHQNAIFHDDDQAEKLRLMKTLSKELKEDFLSKFDSPITGRISAFLPFLPFSPGEQAVVVHKYLLELGQKVRSPVNLSPGPDEHLLGNVKLRIRRDASVCRVLAEEEYHQELGARSLITAVKAIEDMLVEVYLDVDQEIMEGEGSVEFVVDVNGGEVVANMRREVLGDNGVVNEVEVVA